VLYSFCCTELSVRTCTPPWQLGEAHEPGPVYLGGSAVWGNSTPEHSTKQPTKRIFLLTILDRRPQYNNRGIQPI
jgi:hypothetical protein